LREDNPGDKDSKTAALVRDITVPGDSSVDEKDQDLATKLKMIVES